MQSEKIQNLNDILEHQHLIKPFVHVLLYHNLNKYVGIYVYKQCLNVIWFDKLAITDLCQILNNEP